MPATVISSTRPVNADGRHPLPNGRRSAVDAARHSEGAQNVLDFWLSAWQKHNAAQALLSLRQGLPTTRAPSDEAVAPADSTGDKLQVPQQQAQGQQEPRESKSTGSPDGPAPPVSAKSGGRRPLPTSRPVPNSEPQPQKKRKRVDEEEEEEDMKKMDEKKKKSKKSDPKKKVDKTPVDPKNPKPFVCHCGAGFPRQDHLTRHGRIVHGFVCEDGVRRWERYECDACRQLFTRKDNLKAHSRTKHPEAGPAPVPRTVLVDDPDRKRAASAPTSSPTPSAENGEA